MSLNSMHAASRDALVDAEHRLDGVLGDPAVDPATVGDELFGVARLLRDEVSLRRAAADPSVSAEARQQLLRSLLDGKVGEHVWQVIETVVGSRWSNPRELLDGVRSLAVTATLVAAERAGTLESVEDELFGVARAVSNSAELDLALSDGRAPAQSRRELVQRLFGEKIGPISLALVEQIVSDPHGRGVERQLDELSELAARRRNQSVAHVVSATPLTSEQRDALSAKLDRIYGKPITLHVEIDPGVLGGIVVKVGDEVIDGSSAGRIMALRGQMAS
ncbi:MAG: F0F1 ATP synthase subunit delta [Actinophytocola sp.]|nr:F0F1 ATP synthase subunit delta [Actinophytocola sp.]